MPCITEKSPTDANEEASSLQHVPLQTPSTKGTYSMSLHRFAVILIESRRRMETTKHSRSSTLAAYTIGYDSRCHPKRVRTQSQGVPEHRPLRQRLRP